MKPHLSSPTSSPDASPCNHGGDGSGALSTRRRRRCTVASLMQKSNLDEIFIPDWFSWRLSLFQPPVQRLVIHLSRWYPFRSLQYFGVLFLVCLFFIYKVIAWRPGQVVKRTNLTRLWIITLNHTSLNDSGTRRIANWVMVNKYIVCI